jgi:hypothetical protein
VTGAAPAERFRTRAASNLYKFCKIPIVFQADNEYFNHNTKRRLES